MAKRKEILLLLLSLFSAFTFSKQYLIESKNGKKFLVKTEKGADEKSGLNRNGLGNFEAVHFTDEQNDLGDELGHFEAVHFNGEEESGGDGLGNFEAVYFNGTEVDHQV